MNSIHSLHGGMIMSFADYALFIIGHKYTSKDNYVTISCSTEFLKKLHLRKELFIQMEKLPKQQDLYYLSREEFIILKVT